jgi:hypothetical protein
MSKQRRAIYEVTEGLPATQRQLIDLQRRYELLSENEKHRVNEYLLNIYEILGIDPGRQLEEGQNYFQLFQYLLTNVSDHTVRIGRLEQLVEKILVQLSTQTDTDTIRKTGHAAEKNISTHGLEMWADAEGNLLTGDSESDSDMSMRRESDSSTQPSTHMSYRNIRQARSIFPGLPVKEFCAKFGISEQSYYRAMRKRE